MASIMAACGSILVTGAAAGSGSHLSQSCQDCRRAASLVQRASCVACFNDLLWRVPEALFGPVGTGKCKVAQKLLTQGLTRSLEQPDEHARGILVVVINLDRSVDRKEAMTKRLALAGVRDWIRFPAFYGSMLRRNVLRKAGLDVGRDAWFWTYAEVRKKMNVSEHDGKKWAGMRLHDRSAASGISHMMIWSFVARTGDASGFRAAFILEDDMLFTPPRVQIMPMVANLMQQTRADFDIFYLTYMHHLIHLRRCVHPLQSRRRGVGYSQDGFVLDGNRRNHRLLGGGRLKPHTWVMPERLLQQISSIYCPNWRSHPYEELSGVIAGVQAYLLTPGGARRALHLVLPLHGRTIDVRLGRFNANMSLFAVRKKHWPIVHDGHFSKIRVKGFNLSQVEHL